MPEIWIARQEYREGTVEPLLTDQYTAAMMQVLIEAGMTLAEFMSYIACIHADYGVD